MSKTIINLSLSMVSEELDKILDSELFTLYTQALPESELRHKLITYVLSRIPGKYAVLEEAEAHHLNPAQLDWASEQRQHIRALIQQGIEQVIVQMKESVEADDSPSRQFVSDSVESERNLMPSNWFG